MWDRGVQNVDDVESDGRVKQSVTHPARRIPIACQDRYRGRDRDWRWQAGLRGWDALDTDRKRPIITLVVRPIHERRESCAR